MEVFVFEPSIFFKYLKNDKTYLERDPMIKISQKGQLIAFKHYGFWQCMDTIRDMEILNNSFEKKEIGILTKILVVGGTGFVGYHLCKKCLNLKWDVTSISTENLRVRDF